MAIYIYASTSDKPSPSALQGPSVGDQTSQCENDQGVLPARRSSTRPPQEQSCESESVSGSVHAHR